MLKTNINRHRTIALFIGLFVFILGLGFLATSFIPNQVTAQQSREVNGYGWSENIGWINFKHSQNNPVTIDQNGNFSGYGWSENIGWLKFGNDLGRTGARLGSDGKVTGWARFCAGMIAPSGVSTDPNNVCNGADRTDGWDGWVRFDHGRTGEVTVDENGNFSGYAWGNTVVGWIDMSGLSTTGGINTDPCSNSDYAASHPDECNTGGGNPLTATCTVSPNSVTLTDGNPTQTVTYTINASDGTSPYTYNGSSNNSFSFSLGVNNAGQYSGPSVTVTDAEGQNRNINCPSVTVTDNTGGGGGEDLQITFDEQTCEKDSTGQCIARLSCREGVGSSATVNRCSFGSANLSNVSSYIKADTNSVGGNVSWSIGGISLPSGVNSEFEFVRIYICRLATPINSTNCISNISSSGSGSLESSSGVHIRFAITKRYYDEFKNLEHNFGVVINASNEGGTASKDVKLRYIGHITTVQN